MIDISVRTILLFALLLPMAASPARSATHERTSAPVSLRDITITPRSETSALVSFLVDGAVRTVVVDPKPDGLAQIRMKSLKADRRALTSALPKPGLRRVEAHIERVDVLVANVYFDRTVEKMLVVRRDAEQIDVLVTLGSPLATDNTASSGSDEREKWALSTIVVDAGHGGRDPGAIGLDGVVEKDITLKVALYLRDELKRQMPGVNVVLTRDEDTFVELYRRGQIANEHEGRLFVSIHCNALEEKPSSVSGFECYILRPGKSEDAARVAAAENAAIRFESDTERYEEMSTESAIVAGMAQSSFARYSEQLAASIRSAMRGSTGVPDRGVHQAGFYVLVGASMPSVLIEMGYLSNRNDARILKSTSAQKKMARAIARGIKAYEASYSRSLR